MAFDLDSPQIVETLNAKIALQEANLRGLETYARGAKITLVLGLVLFGGSAFSWLSDQRTLSAWLLGYAVLAGVTYYLFAPLLEHYATSARDELAELRSLLGQAIGRKKGQPS